MRRWPRGLPAPVRDLLAPHGERALAIGELAAPGGGYVVATREALHWHSPGAGSGHTSGVPAGGVGPDPQRVPWERVLRASWSEEFLDLVLEDPLDPAGRAVRLRLEAPGEIPDVVRERVTWSILRTQQVVLHPPGEPRRTVQVTARRSAHTAGALWSVTYDPEQGPLTPAQLRAADVAIDLVAQALGIGPNTGPVARISGS